MIAFDLPWLIYVAPAVGLVVMLLAWWARAARIARAGRWSAELATFAEAAGRGGMVLLGIAAFLATMALAGPRFGRRVVTTESKALNLVLAVDISRSMLAEDVQPSRLEKAQREAGRLIQDLSGDRIGLLAFAGQSFILSPLTVDDGALRLLVDGLHPDMASAGGSMFAPVLRQGRQLLLAGEGVADRVLVVFSDGEAMDSMPAIRAEVDALRRDGIRLVLVAEGGVEPATIPVRDPDGVLIGNQRDADNNVIQTQRRDDIMAQIADAAQAAVVSAEVGDQAGTVRELVAAFKRSPMATTTAAQDISRAWVLCLGAVMLLLGQTLSRRTAALASLAFILMVPRGATAQGQAAGRENPADRAWRSGNLEGAAVLYRDQVQRGVGGDTAWFNLGTAALALKDSAVARAALGQAAQSLDPEIRFRALYNLGLMNLRLAAADSANRNAYLDEAQQMYRQALLLRPSHEDAKWNYELTMRQKPPPDDGGSNQQPPSSGSSQEPQPAPVQGLTREQAEQILNSMLEEERNTRDAVNRRSRHSRVGRKDW
jgi:Ca-activated chloride channel homolog